MFHPTSSLGECGKTILAPENFYGPHVWHNRSTFPQDAQKDRSARPQRVKARGVPSWYVEGLNGARTTLEDFFSILLVAGGFEVTRWAILPWDCRLFGLFDEATQIHFRCSE